MGRGETVRGRAWCSKLLIFFYIITRIIARGVQPPIGEREQREIRLDRTIRTVHFSREEKERERERERERGREERSRKKIECRFVLWRSCRPGRRVYRKVRARVVVGDVEDVSRTLYIVL